MPLTTGSRLGPYEILAAIGAGGMGEVYRARDTRLDRIVAIKVLPAYLAADPQFRERFDREAHAIAALNHPHICTLYDVGEAPSPQPSALSPDTVRFLVMEYLEGETLDARLKARATGAAVARGLSRADGAGLPLAEALSIAIEIADALDKAHRAGIVHRDLKPGNVMLTKAGAKLLDFGLAKTSAPVVAGAGLSMLPTTPPHLTAQGTILGTFQYMAPEQLEGQDADARTDIFAFGAVVYEMATGKKAFEGKSQASLIAAILEHEPPPIAATQPLTPPALDRIINKCLAKHPDARWQSASDLADELKWIAETPRDAAVHARRFRTRGLTLWAAVVALAIVGVGATTWMLARATASRPLQIVRSSITLRSGETMPIGMQPTFALAPDGRRIAYVASDTTGQTRMYLRALDQGEPALLTGTEGAVHPFFSPDGRWLAFVAGGKLKKIPVTGGAPVAVCDLTVEMRGATWTDHNTIVFAPNIAAGLWRVSANGGTPQLVVEPSSQTREKSIRWPQALPGGRTVLATVSTVDIESFDDARIETVSLETGERRVAAEGGMYGRYSPTGHLLYARAGSLLAVPFDLATLRVHGTPVALSEPVSTEPAFGYANFAVSDNGSLIYGAGGPLVPQRRIVWVDRDGTATPVAEARRPFLGPRVSPDGRRLAVFVNGANNHVWIYDIARGVFTRLTFASDNNGPIWTPDGTHLTFASNRDGRWGLFVQATDGTGDATRLTSSDLYQFAGSWSADGRVLVYTQLDSTRGFDLWTVTRDSNAKPQPFLRTRFDESHPQLSPDSRWVAYVSNESGRNEVYLRRFPDAAAKRQISTGGGDEAVWARDGRTLFYRDGDQMTAVELTVAGELTATRPRVLFNGPYLSKVRIAGGSMFNFDVAPDGRRFVMILPAEPESIREVALVQNWFVDLKRLAPR